MTDQPATDRTAELEARIADLERRTWRSAVDDSRSGREEAFWAVVHSLFPSEARKHLKNAGREQLMAARVYLDRWIARLEEQEQAAAAARDHETIEIQ
jgi:hypothetical protein